MNASGSLGWKATARAVALPTAAASSRIAFIRGSGAKGLVLADADSGGLPAEFRVEEVDRFAFDDFGDLGVEVEVVGVDGVERLAGSADEFHRGRIGGLGQRVDLQPFLEGLGRASGLPSTSRPRSIEHVDRARRPADEVAVRDLAVVVGGHDQVLPALPAVGPGRAHVDDEPEVGVVDRARARSGVAPRRRWGRRRPGRARSRA